LPPHPNVTQTVAWFGFRVQGLGFKAPGLSKGLKV
jgi:hypothetical protein